MCFTDLSDSQLCRAAQTWDERANVFTDTQNEILDHFEAPVWSYDGEVDRVFDVVSNQQDNNMEANEGMNNVFAMGLVHYRYHAIILLGGTTHIQWLQPSIACINIFFC